MLLTTRRDWLYWQIQTGTYLPLIKTSTASSRLASRQVGFGRLTPPEPVRRGGWDCAWAAHGKGPRDSRPPGRRGQALSPAWYYLAWSLQHRWGNHEHLPLLELLLGLLGGFGQCWRAVSLKAAGFQPSMPWGLRGLAPPCSSLLFCHVFLARQWTFSCPEPVLWART